MNIEKLKEKIENKYECCGKHYKNGAIIPNKEEEKNFYLCDKCYTNLEIYMMIHTPISKHIKYIKEISKHEQKTGQKI